MKLGLGAIGACLLVAATALAGCGAKSSGPVQVVFETSMGTYTVETQPDDAPITVENFLRYVDEGFYDGLVYHRIVEATSQCGIGVVQGGGMDRDGAPAATHDPIVLEAKASVKNTKGTISMARTSAPDSATSQFFINTVDNPFLDATSAGTGYAVFAHVVSGMEVIEAMTKVAHTAATANRCDWVPANPILITSAHRVGVTPVDPCKDLPATAANADLITPGEWVVSSNEEAQYVWLQNKGTEPLAYEWSITGLGGAALPTGWKVDFATPSGTLPAAPCGKDAVSAWVATMVYLTIPSDAPAGDVRAVLTGTNGASSEFVFHVQANRGAVTKVNESVTTHYDLKGEDGERIQEGDFCHVLGGKGAVDGYAWGLIGVAKGETVTLIVPPPFAYKFGGSGLSGQTLNWKATITDIVASCPGA